MLCLAAPTQVFGIFILDHAFIGEFQACTWPASLNYSQAVFDARERLDFIRFVLLQIRVEWAKLVHVKVIFGTEIRGLVHMQLDPRGARSDLDPTNASLTQARTAA